MRWFIIIIGAIDSQGDSKGNESKKADVNIDHVEEKNNIEVKNQKMVI